MSKLKTQNNLALFKLLWLLVIIPKELQLVVLIILALRMGKGLNLKLDFISKCFAVHLLIQIFAVAIAIITRNYTFIRLLAAINTISIGFIALVFFEYFKKNTVDFNDLLKTSFCNQMILLILVFVFMILKHFSNHISLPLIGSLFIREYGLERLRFVGFFEYPTLIVSFTILVMPLGLLYILTTKKNLILVSAIFLVSGLPVFFSYSRAGYILFLLMPVLLILYYLPNYKLRLKIVLTVTALIVAAIFSKYIEHIFELLLQMRKGSNLSRSIIYSESWNGFLSSPIWGCGIKELCSIGVPKGSHCTYLGWLFKTGISGTVFAGLAFFSLYKRIWTNRKASICYTVMMIQMVLMLAYCIFEDLDGANWLIGLFFSVAGITCNNSNYDKCMVSK